MEKQNRKGIVKMFILSSILLLTSVGCDKVYDAMDKIPMDILPDEFALFSVFSGDNLELIKEYIDEGVDVNCTIRDFALHASDSMMEVSPLYLSRDGMSYNARIVEYLLEKGADPNFADSKGRTLLMHAADALTTNLSIPRSWPQAEFVRVLLDYGADIDEKSDEGLTALDYAVRTRHEDIVKFLLDNGAKVSEQTLALTQNNQLIDNNYSYNLTKTVFDAASKQSINYKNDVLLEAAVLGNSDKVTELLNKDNVEEYDKHIPYYIAAYCNTDALKCIESKGYDLNSQEEEYESNSLLNMAAIGGNTDVVKYLTEKGLDINHRAVSNDMMGNSLWAATVYDHYDVASYLLSHGAEFYIPEDWLGWLGQDQYRATNEAEGAIVNGNIKMISLLEQYNYPFNEDNIFLCARRAIEFNQLDMLRHLLGKYIDVNYTTSEGETLLQSACEYDNLDVLKVLNETGAKIAISDSDALFIASEHGNYGMVEYLIKNGMDVDASLKFEDGSTGNTGLSMAISSGYFDIVKLLVENGAELDGDYTALMNAAGSGSYHILEYIIDQDVDIDAQNEYGDTALMYAVNVQNAKCVEVLLNAGADTTLKNNEGLTAKEIAKKTLNSDIIKLFK